MKPVIRQVLTPLLAAAAVIASCGGCDCRVAKAGMEPGRNVAPREDTGGGGSYESVTIGGKTWMKKNLNIETPDSWCYNNSPDSCAKYGRLYTWNAARSACPGGWHLPSRAEWDALTDSAGESKEVNWADGGDTGYYWPGAGAKLKSRTGWHDNGSGTDGFGFSALPGGYRYSGGYIGGAGRNGYWWTAAEYDYGRAGIYLYAYYRGIYRSDGYVNENTTDKNDAFSVRCVHD